MADNQTGEVSIGAKLRELRLLKGIKKIEVLVGRANQGVTNEDELLTVQYVYKLESGVVKSPGIEVLSRYAKGLNMTVGELTDYITGAKKINGVQALSTVNEYLNAALVLEERFGSLKLPVIGSVPTKEPLNVDKCLYWVYIPKAMFTETRRQTMERWRILKADDTGLASEGILENWNIVFDPLDKEIIDGKKYIVRIGDESFAAVVTHANEDTLNVRRFDKDHLVPAWEVKIAGRILSRGIWFLEEE